jgi:hypothetical protein
MPPIASGKPTSPHIELSPPFLSTRIGPEFVRTSVPNGAADKPPCGWRSVTKLDSIHYKTENTFSKTLDSKVGFMRCLGARPLSSKPRPTRSTFHLQLKPKSTKEVSSAGISDGKSTEVMVGGPGAAVGVGVAVAVGVCVGVEVAVAVGGTGVAVATGVAVGVAVDVGVNVGVGKARSNASIWTASTSAAHCSLS